VPISAISFGAITYPPPLETWDIHILRDQSTGDLRDFLWVTDATDTLPKPISMYAGNDVELLFVPVFKIVRDDAEPDFKNFGIRVNKRTGRVSVGADWDPSTSPRNFIVEVYVTDNGNGNPNPNLMSEAGARVNGDPHKIDFFRIKWNWHRVRKASVTTLPIDNKFNGTFHVFAHKGSGNQFAIGDFVRLARAARADPCRSADQQRRIPGRVDPCAQHQPAAISVEHDHRAPKRLVPGRRRAVRSGKPGVPAGARARAATLPSRI
jgi:hypothetical protein